MIKMAPDRHEEVIDNRKPGLPRVSLVLCTINRKKQLRRFFEALRGQVMNDYEVIVVDQNPRDYLITLIQEFMDLPILLLRSVPGLSRSRNIGWNAARADLVGFPDDDCWYTPNTLSYVVEFFDANKKVSVLVGRTLDASLNESLSRFQSKSGPISRKNAFKTGASPSLFVRSISVHQINGFDEGLGVGSGTPFQSGEETDFVLRCIQAGHPAYFDREHWVYHEQVDGSPLKAFKYAKGFGRVLRKHNYSMSFWVLRSSRTTMAILVKTLGLRPKQAFRHAMWLAGSSVGF